MWFVADLQTGHNLYSHRGPLYQHLPERYAYSELGYVDFLDFRVLKSLVHSTGLQECHGWMDGYSSGCLSFNFTKACS